MTPLEIAVLVLSGAGAFFAAVAAVGLVRLPDLYTRSHSVSKSETLGAVLTLAAVALTFGTGLTAVKAALLLLFMFITNPTAAHAITRAAADQGIEPWTVEDAEGDAGGSADGAGTTGTETDGSQGDDDGGERA